MPNEATMQAIGEFQDAVSKEGAAYESDVCPRWERKSATQATVESRAALLAAIDAEVEAARREGIKIVPIERVPFEFDEE